MQFNKTRTYADILVGATWHPLLPAQRNMGFVGKNLSSAKQPNVLSICVTILDVAVENTTQLFSHKKKCPNFLFFFNFCFCFCFVSADTQY